MALGAAVGGRAFEGATPFPRSKPHNSVSPSTIALDSAQARPASRPTVPQLTGCVLAATGAESGGVLPCGTACPRANRFFSRPNRTCSIPQDRVPHRGESTRTGGQGRSAGRATPHPHPATDRTRKPDSRWGGQSTRTSGVAKGESSPCTVAQCSNSTIGGRRRLASFPPLSLFDHDLPISLYTRPDPISRYIAYIYT
jgi:hypothetical protein